MKSMLAGVVGFSALLAPASAWAWKPTTHQVAAARREGSGPVELPASHAARQ